MLQGSCRHTSGTTTSRSTRWGRGDRGPSLPLCGGFWGDRLTTETGHRASSAQLRWYIAQQDDRRSHRHHADQPSGVGIIVLARALADVGDVTRFADRNRFALDALSGWGRDPTSDGGENMAFSLVRQGGVSDTMLVNGDCTPYSTGGARGALHGQPSGFTGEPTAYVSDFSTTPPSLDQLPCTFEFDLNDGKVTLTGAFPDRPSTLTFHVERLKAFDDEGVGDTLLFASNRSSDSSGYILAVVHVAAA